MKKIKMLTIAALMAVMSGHVCAQNFPVGIVSTQDSVKSVQFGIISSVATDGGRGLQLSGVSNTSAHLFNGLQLSSISNITTGMNRGLQLSGILNVSSGMMRSCQGTGTCHPMNYCVTRSNSSIHQAQQRTVVALFLAIIWSFRKFALSLRQKEAISYEGHR